MAGARQPWNQSASRPERRGQRYTASVLAANIELVDLDARHWRRWYELLVPWPMRGAASFALLFIDERRPAVVVAGVMHRGNDHLVPDFVPASLAGADDAGAGLGTLGEVSKAALAAAARELDVDAVVVIDVHATSALYDQIARQLSPDADFVAQGLSALRLMKRRRGQGIWTYPEMLDLIPPVAYEPLQRTFDVLIPDRTSAVFYVFEDDGSDVHSSLIAVKRGGHLDRVSTHLSVEDALAGPALARDWRGRQRQLLALISERHAPASLGVFLSRSTFRRIATGPSDQFAREFSAGGVVIDPAPAWLLGLLGGATVAAFASRGAKALARMLPSPARRVATGFAATAQNVIRDSGAHPFDLLGFDPIALWHELRQLYHD
ncbi:MAG: hypothetical protein Tsb0020_26010 [Haliangiales bacterium]